MTWKELAKAVQSQQQSGPELNTIPRDIPFWIFDKEQHKPEDIRTKGQCCFWHAIKPPQKDGRDMLVLPYQKILDDALQNRRISEGLQYSKPGTKNDLGHCQQNGRRED
jgi:hypothetical protein